ncbi:MAG: carbohydrate ABC transporter permease [Anaerolineae bacterium]|nr:carbohydrate ABC transporter permease [Anaerolineae bacterium]
MYRLSRNERIAHIFIYIILIGLTLAFLLPFIIVLSTSFISEAEFAQRGGYVLFPQGIDLTSYKILFGRSPVILNAYGVTLFRVVVGTFLNLVFTVTLAYVLAQRNLPGRIPLTIFVFVTMVFNGGLIPRFLLVDALGMRNTVWSMIVPVLINAWNMLIMRNFFMSIPEELTEAAIVDGASPATILLRVILPLSLPVIATIGLFYAVYHWNAWFDAAIYIDHADKQPLQIILRGLLQSTTMQGMEELAFTENPPPAASLRSALIIVSTVPVLFVYPFIQRYFVKGIMIGGVKG